MVQRVIISPHIDDEVLGCGGILDGSFHVLECGVDDFHVVPKAERLEELKAAASLLGFSWELLDNKVNSYNTSDLINPITDYINGLQPDEVYVPYPSYNQDHQAVYRACMVALRPHDKNHFVKRIYVYEETQVMVWDYAYDLNASFKPNCFRRIDIDRKIAAYKCMRSQVRSFRSPEFLAELARIRGRQAMLDYAEAFQILRSVE